MRQEETYQLHHDEITSEQTAESHDYFNNGKNFENINPIGPDNLVPEYAENYSFSDSERKYAAIDLGPTAVDVSQEALKDLTPKERLQRRYAQAASYFHEDDRLRSAFEKAQAAGDLTEVNRILKSWNSEELRHKAKNLYDQADALYESEVKNTLDDTTSHQTLGSISGVSLENQHYTAYTEHQPQKVSIEVNGQNSKEDQLQSQKGINLAVREFNKKIGYTDGLGNEVVDSISGQYKGVEPKVQFQQQAKPEPKGFFSRIGRLFGRKS